MTIKPHNRHATLFTDTVDPSTAETVRRIMGRHDRFATDFIATLDPATGEPVLAIRLEAWRDKDTGAWAIDRLTYVPKLDTFDKKTEALPGLCFFDALYHCARFQATQLAVDDERQIAHVPGARWESCISYRDAADAASQVIDAAGIVHPCADGRILTDGAFDSKAMETAFKTAEQPLAPKDVSAAAPGFAGSFLAVNRPLGVPAVADRLQKYSEKRRALDETQAAINNLDAVISAAFRMENALYHLEFLASERNASTISAILTLGLAPAIGYLRGNERYTPGRFISGLKRQFEKSVRRLEDSPEKTLMADFVKAAESTFWLERAARIIHNDNQLGRHSRKTVEKAMGLIELGAAAIGLSPLDTGRLKDEFLDPCFKPGTFLAKLRAVRNAHEGKIHYKIYRLEGGAMLNGDEKIGQLLPDGSIFGGISPTTNRAMFIAPVDMPEAMTWYDAVRKIALLKDFHGADGIDQYSQIVQSSGRSLERRKGWRLPTTLELNLIYWQLKRETGNLIKESFNHQSSKNDETAYWSLDLRDHYKIQALSFGKGYEIVDKGKDTIGLARCVRS